MWTTRILFWTTSVATFLLLPDVSVAQFGLGMNRRNQQGGGASFQELQEAAKKQQEAAAGGGAGAAGMGGDMAKMLEDAMKDPEAREYLEKMGHNFEQAMEQLAKMSPEEMKKQMGDALSAMTDSSMLDAIVGSRDDVIKQLEMTKAIPADELAKMKADPEYFELKMRESFGHIQSMFDDPEMAEYMAQAISGMQEMFSAGGALMSEIEKLVESGDLTDDDKIEEARLALLQGDFGENPLLTEMLAKDEMKDVIKDANKFRDSVKQGQSALGLGGMGAAAGARVGEL